MTDIFSLSWQQNVCFVWFGFKKINNRDYYVEFSFDSSIKTTDNNSENKAFVYMNENLNTWLWVTRKQNFFLAKQANSGRIYV